MQKICLHVKNSKNLPEVWTSGIRSYQDLKFSSEGEVAYNALMKCHGKSVERLRIDYSENCSITDLLQLLEFTPTLKLLEIFTECPIVNQEFLLKSENKKGNKLPNLPELKMISFNAGLLLKHSLNDELTTFLPKMAPNVEFLLIGKSKTCSTDFGFDFDQIELISAYKEKLKSLNVYLSSPVSFKKFGQVDLNKLEELTIICQEMNNLKANYTKLMKIQEKTNMFMRKLTIKVIDGEMPLLTKNFDIGCYSQLKELSVPFSLFRVMIQHEEIYANLQVSFSNFNLNLIFKALEF